MTSDSASFHSTKKLKYNMDRNKLVLYFVLDEPECLQDVGLPLDRQDVVLADR